MGKCDVNFLDVVHRPGFQNTTFQCLDLSPSSGVVNKGGGGGAGGG
jgi:hypothetical protein